MRPNLPGGRKEVKARAVRELRAALMNGGPVAAALRACCYRHPIFFTMLFRESLADRFRIDRDVREITAFVARVREARGSAAAGFPSREAEGIIRAILGDALMEGQVDPYAFSYPEIGIALMTRLFAEWQPSADQVDALISRSEALTAEKARLALLAEREDLWFAAGMPDSPFATLDEPVEPPKTER